jgi:hypothetical protein
MKTPTGLKSRGRALWRTFQSEFDVTETEEQLLVEACREVDLLDVLEQELCHGGVWGTGSQGQRVASPLVNAINQSRTILTRILAQLAPDDEDASTVSRGATAMAQARWAKKP